MTSDGESWPNTMTLESWAILEGGRPLNLSHRITGGPTCLSTLVNTQRHVTYVYK